MAETPQDYRRPIEAIGNFAECFIPADTCAFALGASDASADDTFASRQRMPNFRRPFMPGYWLTAPANP
jgi:hypothetical protein